MTSVLDFAQEHHRSLEFEMLPDNTNLEVVLQVSRYLH